MGFSISQRESAKEYGKWASLISSGGGEFIFNSSHTFPLTIEDYISNVIALEQGKPLRTLYAEIRPTTVCNHDCLGCFSEEFRKVRKELHPDRLRSLIQELHDLNVGLIRFSGGGDPLLYKGIEGFIEQSSKLGMGTVMITNGSLLEVKDIPALAENLNLLRVSINGGEETHAIIHKCPEKTYKKIIGSLASFSSIRKERGLDERLYLGVTYLVYPENIQEIGKTARELKNAGVDGVYFRATNNHKQFTRELLERLKQEAALSGAISDDQFFVHFAQRLFNANANPSVNQTYCYSAQFRLYVEADGQVTGCGRWSGTKSFQFGNINSQSIKEIVENSDVLKKIKNTKIMRCTGCDCAYFNKAMEFVHNEYKRNPNVSFERKFE